MKTISLDQCVEMLELSNGELAAIQGGAWWPVEVVKWVFRTKTVYEVGRSAYEVCEAYAESYTQERYFDPFVS